jgi:hypothetical protein|tara:strand:- start:46 stop:690 length:645 start_codon:yes stop_codon:yes gene_type:complete
MSFKKNKYQVIKGAVSKEIAEIGFKYLQISAEADHWMLQNSVTHTSNTLVGNFKDKQVPNSYAKYADRFMETLLIKTIPTMEKKTGLKLIPTYSYCRLYRKGNILKRHKDRPSCEISTTLNLGGDPWPIFIDPTGSNNVIDEYKNIHKPNAPKGNRVDLKPGDMLIYSGCELEHWREPFEGKLCGQVFLHYNHANGPFAKTNLYDKRPLLGIPK